MSFSCCLHSAVNSKGGAECWSGLLSSADAAAVESPGWLVTGASVVLVAGASAVLVAGASAVLVAGASAVPVAGTSAVLPSATSDGCSVPEGPSSAA